MSNSKEVNILDALGLLIIGGLLGYSIGKSQEQRWENFRKNFEERLDKVRFMKIFLPVKLWSKDLVKDQEERWANYFLFWECMRSYLFGNNVASLSLATLLLEKALRIKLGKEDTLGNLIKELESEIQKDKSLQKVNPEILHSLKNIRNFVHHPPKRLPDDPITLKLLKDIFDAIKFILPFEKIILSIKCPLCGEIHSYEINHELAFVGFQLSLLCDKTKQYFSYELFTGDLV